MKDTLKITGVLTLTCLLCAFVLAFAFNASQDKIDLNAKKKIEDSISKLAPQAVTVKEENIEQESIYQLFDRNKELIGFAFLAEGNGYQDKIKVLAVIDPAIKNLKGIEIIESNETPGLGGKIMESSFKNQFQSLYVVPEINYLKDKPVKPNEIQAITGATISSRSVVAILNKRIEELKKTLK